MIRTGYQIFNFNKEFQGYIPFSSIYMSKKEAEINMSALSFLNMKLLVVDVVENDESIDDFYNQIEQENPEYQAALTEALIEVKQEIENPTSSNNPYVDSTGKVTDTKRYLTHLSNEALGLNWLSTVSICGGD